MLLCRFFEKINVQTKILFSFTDYPQKIVDLISMFHCCEISTNYYIYFSEVFCPFATKNA